MHAPLRESSEDRNSIWGVWAGRTKSRALIKVFPDSSISRGLRPGDWTPHAFDVRMRLLAFYLLFQVLGAGFSGAAFAVG